jgi:hypothetical protein
MPILYSIAPNNAYRPKGHRALCIRSRIFGSRQIDFDKLLHQAYQLP